MPVPDGFRPNSLATDGRALWVGGRLLHDAGVEADGVTGSPAVIHADGSAVTHGDGPAYWSVIEAAPETTYGRQADLIHLIVAQGIGEEAPGEPEPIQAIGIAVGGQHLLPRWTVWSGTPTHLIELDQLFETFGGLSAGGLVDLAFTDRGPRILGAWSPGNRYMGVALWSLAGTTWARDTIPALDSTAALQQLGRAMDIPPRGVVIVGSSARFDGIDPLSKPTVWLGAPAGAPDGTWTSATLRLDRPSTLASVAGTATDVACQSDGCWAAGALLGADGAWKLAAWRVDLRRLDRQDPPEMFDLPANVAGKQPQVVALADGSAVLTDPVGESIVVVGADGWQRVGTPPGTVLDLVAVGEMLYATVERPSEPDATRSLWRFALTAPT